MEDSSEIDYNTDLWFYHNGCKGKHYLLDNPHTFFGRILAWCPENGRSIFVSKYEMGEMSEASKYWIEGFLKGNQPSPPTDEDGMPAFESKAYELWEDEMELFSETGFWTYDNRFCDKCNSELLKSNPTETCIHCFNK